MKHLTNFEIVLICFSISSESLFSSGLVVEAFFDKGELTEDELRGGLHSAILSGNLLPVFCVSSKKNIGVKHETMRMWVYQSEFFGDQQ